MTDTPVTVQRPDYTADKAFLKEASFTFYADALDETGEFPRGGLLLKETMPHVIWRGPRRIGALSLVGNFCDDGSPEVRIDTLWIARKFRGRGFSEGALRFLADQCPYPVGLRAPVHPALRKAADRTGVRAHEESPLTAERARLEMAEGLAEMNQRCVHGTSCRPCLFTLLRKVIDVAWACEEIKIAVGPPPFNP